MHKGKLMSRINRILQVLFIIIIFLISSQVLKAQSSFGIGCNLGGGTIGGNLPAQGSFNSSIFVEGNPGIPGNIIFRLSFVFASDINILLPQNSSRYSPFIKGYSLKGITSETVSETIYIEEGLGLLALNDRTFSNVNEWDYGASFSIMPGIDLRDDSKTGFKLGVGSEYGLTFTNTNVWFLSIHFQAEYYF